MRQDKTKEKCSQSRSRYSSTTVFIKVLQDFFNM